MNADILKRVVRAIADGSQSDLDRLAGKIVEAERKTGHVRLAEQLEAILKQPKTKRALPSLTPSADSTPATWRWSPDLGFIPTELAWRTPWRVMATAA